jgi:hypothetical protein
MRRAVVILGALFACVWLTACAASPTPAPATLIPPTATPPQLTETPTPTPTPTPEAPTPTAAEVFREEIKKDPSIMDGLSGAVRSTKVEAVVSGRATQEETEEVIDAWQRLVYLRNLRDGLDGTISGFIALLEDPDFWDNASVFWERESSSQEADVLRGASFRGVRKVDDGRVEILYEVDGEQYSREVAVAGGGFTLLFQAENHPMANGEKVGPNSVSCYPTRIEGGADEVVAALESIPPETRFSLLTPPSRIIVKACSPSGTKALFLVRLPFYPLGEERIQRYDFSQ